MNITKQDFQQLITWLKHLTNHKERNIKRHAHALLIQLQNLPTNEQDND
jgi:hypothetical protein